MRLNFDGLPVVKKIKQEEFVTILVIHVIYFEMWFYFSKPLKKDTQFNWKNSPK